MLLIISNSSDATADFLAAKIVEERYPFLRLDTDKFPLKESLRLKWTQGLGLEAILSCDRSEVNLQDITCVWWRRPQDYGRLACEKIRDQRARDFAQKQIRDCIDNLESLLSANGSLLWVNHPNKNFQANAKFHQLCVADRLGFRVPDTILSNDPHELQTFFDRHNGHVVFKANRRPAFLGEEGMFGFYTTLISRADLEQSASVRIAPVYLQELIPKKFELRVTVIGSRVLSARIESQNHPEGVVDWRQIPIKPGLWQPTNIDSLTEQRCNLMLRELGLNFGAIDLAVTPDNEVVFFEINPNGQWAWLEIETGLPMVDSFFQLFFGRG